MKQYLERVGHVALENPIWLVGYSGRLLASLRFTVADVLSPRGAWRLTRTLARQTFKTFFRGFFLILALSIAAAIAMGWLATRLGGVVRGAFDELVIPLLVAYVLPLGLAVVLVGRTGATIAVRFAAMPIKTGGPVRFGPRDLQREVVPHLFASVVTAAVFYLMAAWLLLAAYHGAGLTGALRTDLSALFSTATPWPPLWSGAQLALLFGFVIAGAASGLGIQVAERYNRLTSPNSAHYVVWETVVLVTIACALLTLLRALL